MKKDAKTMVSIVSNSRPVYVATPIIDEKNNITEIDIEPVVAWKVMYDEDENSFNDYAEPIIHGFIPQRYATYDYETGIWNESQNFSGKGLDTLVQHFQEFSDNKKRLSGEQTP